MKVMAAFVLVAIALVGCGGGSGDRATPDSRFTLHLTWGPKEGKGLNATESVRFRLETVSGSMLREIVYNRGTGTEIISAFAGIPYNGPAIGHLTAFSAPGAKGKALATVSQDVVVPGSFTQAIGN